MDLRHATARLGSRWAAFRHGWDAFLLRRDTLLGMNARNLHIVFESNERRHFPMVDDKVLTKQLLAGAGVEVPRTLGLVQGFPELDQMDRWLDPHTEFVIKPAKGSGGNGIFISAGRWPGGVISASGRRVSKADMDRHVAEILYGSFSTNRSDCALVEERIHPHGFFRDFHPVGLADIRVIVYRGRPALCMLRLPTAGSKGTANLHQGGVGVGVELTSGLTVKAVCKGRNLDRHPDSGKPLLGIPIPSWNRVVETAVKAAGTVPLKYVGVDIVLDDLGRVLVLELNGRPGLQIQNAVGKGLREALLGDEEG